MILLMFGVGIHFRSERPARVRADRRPGRGRSRSRVATGLGRRWRRSGGAGRGAGLLFGLALSVASTVVLLRGLADYDDARHRAGRIAVGWLIVEDLVVVIALVLLPAVLGAGGAAATSRVASCSASRCAQGRLLRRAHARRRRARDPRPARLGGRTGSRELFILAVLVVALGIAYGAAELFGVSLALGAFLAGMVVAVGVQPPRGRGGAAAARRVRGPVLRVGRHAVRSLGAAARPG